MPWSAPQPTRLSKSVAIEAPVATVFAFWGDIQNYPRFIPMIDAVHALDAKRSRWIVQAPLGRSVVFDSEVVEWVPDRLMAWETRHTLGHGRGVLTFGELGRATRVDCVFEYALGPLWLRQLGTLMSRLGFPSEAFDEGLRRIKREIEAGARQAPSAPQRQTLPAPPF